jgi:hypothetical protein
MMPSSFRTNQSDGKSKGLGWVVMMMLKDSFFYVLTPSGDCSDERAVLD